MPFYEYQCKNEQCGRIYTIKSPEPLKPEELSKKDCEDCHSPLERKLSIPNILGGSKNSFVAKTPCGNIFVGEQESVDSHVHDFGPIQVIHSIIKIKGRLQTPGEMN